jgi:alpha-glucosidase
VRNPISSRRQFSVIAVFVLIVLGERSVAGAADETRRVAYATSPDGKNFISVKIDRKKGQLLLGVARGKTTVVELSPIDVRLADIGALTTGVSIEQFDERLIDTTSDMLWGKSRQLRDHCRKVSLRLRNGSGHKWLMQLRAYDDGVAFRYGFPEDSQPRNVVIESESTQYLLPGDPSVTYMAVDGFQNNHESLYERKPLSAVPAGKLIDKPLLAVWPNGTAAAITEARLRNFAGMYLERPKQGGPNVLRCRLSPLLNKPNAVVSAKAPFWSSWRVVMLADHAGKMIESNLLLCLNDPPDRNYEWVKPGKTTWHWWNGTVEHGPPSTPDHNFAVHKQYIDFCARNKIAYHSVLSVAESRPWYTQGGGPGFDPRPDSDVATPRPDLDCPRILAYAKEKGVGIRLWVWWEPLSRKLEEAFATYEHWGIKGLMVDFMDRDDQEMVEWQEKCLRVAAKHKLHIQFHGSYKPTGEQRTFPNMFNREGVLNLEYLKWSADCSPPHNVNVAYTRLLTGPIDYHSGGFRAASQKEFKPRDELPLVMGTRCHQLAMYVVYENPMPMVCDVPSAYEGQPGFDFIVDVPTTWDETRFVAGEVGEYVVVARRSGDTWYVGGMTNWTARTVELPLNFLGKGKFAAKLYADRSLDGENPNELRIEARDVSSKDNLKVQFAVGGGFVAVLRPK